MGRGEQSGRTSKCKGTEAGRYLASLRNSKDCRVAGKEESGEEVMGRAGTGLVLGLLATVSLWLLLSKMAATGGL